MKIYFDENFSPHLAEGMKAFQSGRRAEDTDVVWIPDEFERGCPDETWIPAIAQKHGVVITQDQNIHRVRAQAALCRQNKIGIIFLKRPKKEGLGYWTMIETIVKHWSAIKVAARETERPFAFILDPAKAKLERIA